MKPRVGTHQKLIKQYGNIAYKSRTLALQNTGNKLHLEQVGAEIIYFGSSSSYSHVLAL